MGYYTRLLTPSEDKVSLSDLQDVLKNECVRAFIKVEQGTSEDWTQLAVSDEEGKLVILIERNDVFSDSLGEEEIEEFLSDIVDCEPSTGAMWLKGYLTTVRVIYAFQHLKGAMTSNGRIIYETLSGNLWSRLKGILQADSEGFTNEEGFHILWQFGEKATGKWHMSVLDDAGQWVNFCIDLANPEHKAAFKLGKIPDGVPVT